MNLQIDFALQQKQGSNPHRNVNSKCCTAAEKRIIHCKVEDSLLRFCNQARNMAIVGRRRRRNKWNRHPW